jgi:hypothetical protein
MRATRRWLMAAAGLAAIPIAPGTNDLTVQGRRLVGLLHRPESARRIAVAYLSGIGASDARRAAMDLNMETALAPLNQIAGATAARAWLGSQIRADFEAGAVIDLDGWRLSRTEVGACLLVASVV